MEKGEEGGKGTILLTDLNNHLFAQLERLNKESLSGEKLQEEIVKAKAISGIAAQIINNGALVLEAMKWQEERLDANAKLPPMLEGVVEEKPKEKRKCLKQ